MQEKEKEIWLRTYHAARSLWTAAPWKLFSNSDIVRVNLPEYGDAYALILGNGRQQYGISVFAGEGAREQLIRRFCYMNKKFKYWPMDEAGCQDCLTLDFDADSVVDETYDEQLKLRKSLGVNPWFPKDRRPCLSHYRPFMLPAPMNVEEAKILTAVIYEVIEATRAIDFPDRYFHFDDIDVYSYDKEKEDYTREYIKADEDVLPVLEMGSVSWKDIYDLKKQRRIPVELELDAGCSEVLSPCEEGAEFIRVCVLSVVEGGIYGTEMVHHNGNIGQTMLDLLVAFCKKEGIPEVVYVRNEEAVRQIAPLVDPLGIAAEIDDLDGEEHMGWYMITHMDDEDEKASMLEHVEELLVNLEMYTERELTKYRMQHGEEAYQEFLLAEFADLLNRPEMEEFKRMLALGPSLFGDDDE